MSSSKNTTSSRTKRINRLHHSIRDGRLPGAGRSRIFVDRKKEEDRRRCRKDDDEEKDQ